MDAGNIERGSVRIAVNTMRARLTVLGFNLAIATFQVSSLPRRSGGAPIPGLEGTLHLSPAVLLLLGISLSLAAMVAFIASGRLDERGDCTHWSLLLGDILMYLAMAQSVGGLFEPTLRDLAVAQVEGTAVQASFDALRTALAIAGGLAWAAATYLGPAVSLARSPFGRPATTAIGVLYFLMLIVLSAVWAEAGEAQTGLGVAGQPRSWLLGLAAPLAW